MKNSCKNIEKLISCEIDEILSEADQYILGVHLQKCADCQALYIEFVKLHEQIHSRLVTKRTSTLDESFEQRFFIRLSQETANPFRPTVQLLRFRMLPVIVGLLLILGLISVKPFTWKEKSLFDTDQLALKEDYAMVSAAINKFESEENKQLADRQTKEILRIFL